jgi:hypothetical protein
MFAGFCSCPTRAPARDFDASDEDNVRELAALIGETLDALRRGANTGELVQY